YAVCSMEPEETDRVIEIFLEKHPQFELQTPDQGELGNIQPVFDGSGFFRSLPHIHGMDGFFAARLKRRS
ncbi:MAG: 16S rRNA (cytosine(967)-C(5))-methyltransferase RsmB, partial [Desulfobacterales bacterium]